VDPDEVAKAKETLRFLDKMVKTRGLFGPGHMNVERATEEFKEKIGGFLDVHGELTFDFEGSKIFYKGAQIADNEDKKDHFSVRLFQDGVIELKLLPGIDSREIDSLLEILLANYSTGKYCHDDTVTLFWELNPKHFRFALAPDFDDSGGDRSSGAEGTEDYRKIRVALTERTAEAGPEIARRASADETQQIAQLDQFSRAGKLAFTDEIKQFLLAEVAKGEPSLLGKYTEVLLRVITHAENAEHKQRLQDVIRTVFLGMAEGPGVVQACALLERLRVIAKDPEVDAGIKEALALVLARVGDAEMVARTMRGLAPQKAGDVVEDAQVNGVLRLIALLGPVTIPHVLDGLHNVPNPQVREKLADLLARLGPNKVDLFKERLGAEGAKSVGEILHILIKIGTPEAMDAMLDAAEHPRPEIRLKVVNEFGSASGKKVTRVVLERINDEDDRVRQAAITKLETLPPEDIVRPLKEAIRSQDFQYRDKDEKRRLFAVLGEAGGQNTLPFFRECFETKNTLKRASIDELRACGAYMLGVMGDEASRKALEKGAKSRLTSSFFKWACSQAVGMLDGKIDPKARQTRVNP
jgi:hypothetical protein